MVKGYLYLLTVVQTQWKHVHYIVFTNHLQALMTEIPHPHFGALAALAHPMMKFLDMFSKNERKRIWSPSKERFSPSIGISDIHILNHRLVSQTLPAPGEDVLQLTLPAPVSNVGWRRREIMREVAIKYLTRGVQVRPLNK